jgi:DNA adenine methylase
MFAYIGGKKSHTKWIDPLIPNDFDTYVEPFGGAFWVYWQSKKTPVTTNVYNDFNRHLVNVFECCKNPQHYHQVLLSYYKDVGDSAKFNQYRDEIFSVFNNNFVIPDYDLAAKYMLLQTQHFSGGIGLSEKIKIYTNTKYKSKYYTYTEKFEQKKYLEKMKHLTTENMDCRDLIRKYDSERTFFYIDPPYFNMEFYYTKTDFGREDHLELLNQLTTIKGKFALSYYYFPELEQILPRNKFYWHEQETITNNGLTKVDNPTRKDGTAAKGVRKTRTEVLIMNYPPPNATTIENTDIFEIE